LLNILFGFSSALVWGAADFCGGLASRKARAYQAVLYGEVVGLAVLLIPAFLTKEKLPDWGSWLLCATAGSLGVLGLMLFFQYLTRGQMSVAAPVSALMAAALPVVVGIFSEGFPGWQTLAGFALALAAIWLISQENGQPKSARVRFKDLRLPLIAGVSFGIYLILFNHGSREGLFWPLVASRSAGVVTMVLYTMAGRKPFLPAKPAWLLIALNGILDVIGNALYLLAGQSGRMDIAAVLASLYPGSTVLLAWLLLHEGIHRLKLIGILAALAAIVLMMMH